MPKIFADKAAQTLAELHAEFDEAAAEFAKKATHHIRKKGCAEEIDYAEALLASSHIDGNPLASSASARWAAQKSLRKALKKLCRADPALEFRSVTVILNQFIASDERTVIRLSELIGRTRSILRRMSPHFNAMVEFQVSANQRHADGGKQLCAHVHAVIYGRDIGDRAHAVAAQVNKRLGSLPNGMRPVNVSEACLTAMSMARAVAYPFHLPDRCKTLYLEPNSGKANQHESTKGDRMIRYERMFEVLSSVAIAKLMFAGGDGRFIKTASIHAARNSLLQSKAPFIHKRDFWRRWRQKTNTSRFAEVAIK